MAPNPAVCKMWLKGNCRYGQQCRFAHESRAGVSTDISGTTAIPPPVAKPTGKERLNKKDFQRRKMMKPSGQLLKEIKLDSIEKSSSHVHVTGSVFVASYNWCNSDKPVIFVPGCPARWKPPKLPHQVEKDNGQLFIDQNNHRSPSASFDPFFKALLTMQPNFSMKSIDLTTDRNSLRKLIRFVSGNVPESWRIDVDVIENTMFFTRWEQSQIQIITGNQNSGYGHGFEKSFLTHDLELQDSSGHHRIIRYNLGGIECLVRFEVDGCIDNDASVEEKTSQDFTDTYAPAIDGLNQGLSALNIQDPEKLSFDSVPAAEVRVIERGRLIEDRNILELKSRSKKIQMLDITTQLWISQTPHLFVGYHVDGLVKVAPTQIDMAEHFLEWENKRHEQLSALVGLIQDIKDVARRSKHGKCMLICNKEEKPRVLRVYERSGKDFFLPKGSRERLWALGSHQKK